MTYLERRLKGSFRGAAFYTPNSEIEGGLRGTVHEYPAASFHTTQNIGPAIKRFRLTVFVDGPDYDLLRNALIQALDKGGPGRLVHRYYGEIEAELEPGQKYTVTESDADGPKATFSIPFIRASRTTPPNIRSNSAQRVAIAAANARTYARATFNSKMDQSGPEFIRDAIIGTINTASSALASVNRKINGALAITSGVQAAISTLNNNAANLASSPATIITLSEQIMAIPAEMFEGFVGVADALKATRDAFNGKGLESARAETEARKLGKLLCGGLNEIFDTDEAAEADVQMAQNQKATLDLVKNSSAIEAAVASLAVPYDSQETADTTRDALSDVLDQLAQAANDDNLYAALMDLRVELRAALTATAGALPELAEYVPHRTIPALLLAHLVHGDARRCEEIIARNNLRHPGFVAMARPVKVLNA